ncbi:MAG: glycoside hydrolase family 3 C-terminal domain-containing protein [Myxococcales bacterium]|nr:glycoside hydrolase family 3 C-terminal domain-containing protein [Myxococcales bacterium]
MADRATADLLARMTLAQKVGQMAQLAIPGDELPDETLDAIRAGRVGSFLNTRSLEQRNRLQRIAVEESPLGIPLIFGRDVIHGFKTIFPIPLAQAATFHPQLVEEAAATAAREAREAGVDWAFAPMVDIARDPRWGRIAEGFGEDPRLAGEMGAAVVRGFQGDGDVLGPGRVAACAKHFAGYGAVEAGREYNTTWIPEQLLREIHLVPFKACVDAGVFTVMSAFSDLNGVPATGNERLLRGILKAEWGFSGFVVSDWAAVTELVQHGLAGDEARAAVQAVRAGLDMEMASRAFADHLERLVEDGIVPLGVVDGAVWRILTIKRRVGLFERPYVEPPPSRCASAAGYGELTLARQLARESVVLLKNDDRVLPVRPDVRSIAVVGPLADDAREQLGCWAYDGDAGASVTALSALRERCGSGIALHHEKGLADCRSDDRHGFDAAVAAALRSDLVLAFVGEGGNLTGEARSRAFLDLPGAQNELLSCLAQTGRPLVTVFMAGRPLIVGRACELSRAAVYAWHGGTMAGPAIADVLFGDLSPCGKLPVSFPRTVGQVPIYYSGKNTGRPARGGARGIPPGTPLDPVGFESTYLDVDVTPEYPFGFGLSYTEFQYGDLRVTPARARDGEPVRAAFRVTNVGDVSGVEVAQLYVRDRVASVTRPLRELKRFARVALEAKASAVVEFTLAPADIAFVGNDMRATIEPGVFDVFVGGDSRATLAAVFELSQA